VNQQNVTKKATCVWLYSLLPAIPLFEDELFNSWHCTSYFNFNRPSNTLSLNQSVTTLPAAKSNCPPDVQHKLVYLNIITRTTPRGHTCFVDAVTAQQTITASLYNRHVLLMHSLHSRPQLLRFTMDMSEQTLIRGHPKTGPVHAHIAILST